jgi:hypothetical protein
VGGCWTTTVGGGAGAEAGALTTRSFSVLL